MTYIYNINTDMHLDDFLNTTDYTLKFTNESLSKDDSDIFKKIINKLLNIKNTFITKKLKKYIINKILVSDIINIEDVKIGLALFDIVCAIYNEINNESHLRPFIKDNLYINKYNIKKKGITIKIFEYFLIFNVAVTSSHVDEINTTLDNIIQSFSHKKYQMDHYNFYDIFIYMLVLCKTLNIKCCPYNNSKGILESTFNSLNAIKFCLKIKPEKNKYYLKELYTLFYLYKKNKDIEKHEKHILKKKDIIVDRCLKKIKENNEHLLMINNIDYNSHPYYEIENIYNIVEEYRIEYIDQINTCNNKILYYNDEYQKIINNKNVVVIRTLDESEICDINFLYGDLPEYSKKRKELN